MLCSQNNINISVLESVSPHGDNLKTIQYFPLNHILLPTFLPTSYPSYRNDIFQCFTINNIIIHKYKNNYEEMIYLGHNRDFIEKIIITSQQNIVKTFHIVVNTSIIKDIEAPSVLVEYTKLFPLLIDLKPIEELVYTLLKSMEIEYPYLVLKNENPLQNQTSQPMELQKLYE
jgi:hypothetical protein